MVWVNFAMPWARNSNRGNNEEPGILAKLLHPVDQVIILLAFYIANYLKKRGGWEGQKLFPEF